MKSFENLEEEIKKYTEFQKKSQSTLYKLSYLYKQIGKNGVTFVEKTKKLLDDFFSDVTKEDRSTSLNKALSNFYNEKNKFLTKLTTFFQRLEKKIGDKVANFEKDYRDKNKETLNKFNRLKTLLYDSKWAVEKNKNYYFDLCKNNVELQKKISLQEEKIKNLENNPEDGGGNVIEDLKKDLTKLNTQFTKSKDNCEAKKKIYQNEVIKLNKLLESNEDRYLDLLRYFENEQNNKITFLNNILKDTVEEGLSFTKDYNESLNKIDAFQREINLKKDNKIYKIDFNFVNNSDGNRFILEQFLDYGFLRKNADNVNNNNQTNNNINNNNANTGTEFSNIAEDTEYVKALHILNLGEQRYLDFDSLNEKGQEINNIIINLIKKEENIENKEFLTIIEYIENNAENSKNFMQLLVSHFCNKELIKIKCVDNFINLSNILIIILNYSFDKKDIFELCYLVMFISESTICLTKDETQIQLLMSKYMAKQSIFNSINFWRDLITTKIEMEAEVDIRREMRKRNKAINVKNTQGIFDKFFGNAKIENTVIENEILVGQIFKEKCSEYCVKVLYEFIKKFNSFNFNYLKASELLDLLFEKYYVNTDYQLYFKNILVSDHIFKKNQNNNSNKEVNYDKLYMSFSNKKKFRHVSEDSLKCVILSLKFLDIKDYTSLLCLNKSFNKEITKIIYKNLLLKYSTTIDIKKHLQIWKLLLDYKTYKKKYDYNLIKEEIKTKKIEVLSANIIDLDVRRTSFSKDKEIKREKITNILKVISNILPSLNYCQGMNCIASFLLNICNDDEEEAFYLYISFLNSTVYSNLFKNEMESMNKIFYEFDRILNISIPEISFFLKINGVTSGYFISPWFITMFTSAFNDDENKNNAKNIMRIWDLFIFGGWKSIIKIGLILLKKNECGLMKTTPEELLNFLTNGIADSQILKKECFDELMAAIGDNTFNVKTDLIENIEKEYEGKKKLKMLNDIHKLNTY